MTFVNFLNLIYNEFMCENVFMLWYDLIILQRWSTVFISAKDRTQNEVLHVEKSNNLCSYLSSAKLIGLSASYFRRGLEYNEFYGF